MPRGIIVFGPNGCGKSTLGRELARALKFKYMDIEEYHFIKSKIPYTAERPRQECINLMRADIEAYRSFVLSAVTGDFGEEISAMYALAVRMTAPLDLRLERIQKRALRQYGERVREGGDLYEQNMKFLEFAATRSFEKMERWAETLRCPVITVDGAESVAENTKRIIEQYYASISEPVPQKPAGA